MYSELDSIIKIHIQYLVDHSWNIFIPKSLAVSHSSRPDTYGWHFTIHEKYTMRSGYKTKIISRFVNRSDFLQIRYYLSWLLSEFLSNVKAFDLASYIWNYTCHQKFEDDTMWYTMQYLWSRRRINHIFFKCPPSIQMWALSKIPYNSVLSNISLFFSIDYLLWRLLWDYNFSYFSWLCGIFGKNQNDISFFKRNQFWV